ncbi:MAG TPA: alpha/beta hydrolase family protein [Candidatus Latescibacteria bacterium]|nr:alpha/beta hydrolase family protein [Candidatus Latescibacterota bacterium]
MDNAADKPGRYMAHQYLRDRWDRTGRLLAFRAKNEEEWKVWRKDLLRVLRRLTGYDTMLMCPLNPTVTETAEFDDYVRERVEIETEPGIVMPLFVLVPKQGTPPYPAVIAPHGHGGGGKAAVVGLRERPEVAKAIDHYNYAYGVSFVRAGFITFCPDARGFGERQEAAVKGNVLASSCSVLNNMAYPLGQTVTGMWAWDLTRLVDYIETRSDCRRDRIGCAGLSGGGLQTLWATAFDERITCAVISGYLYGYKDSLLDLHQNCSCNYVPHLYEYVDMGDIAATIAPRPILIETGNKDALNGARGVENVTSQVDIIRKSYGIFGVQDRVFHDVFEGEHRWNGVHALPWLEKWLK